MNWIYNKIYKIVTINLLYLSPETRGARFVFDAFIFNFFTNAHVVPQGRNSLSDEIFSNLGQRVLGLELKATVSVMIRVD